ncbi:MULTISPECIES: HrpB1 family type III secretion system apparatus protein [Paraburkholderia]|jgi:type III secretion protein HrpB1|uniref:HrpB1 family type III secretion system apparatus protein n=2 Tax=Paraburkholderia TaxID=1822464 RepID=A0A370MZD1_9BURK|nr:MULTISPECIES: HrpB1 family type III secretion system apparatus protein [Paraburkholderia]MCP2090000.1 type III secretion protein HrpB1 [Paraburkholderia sediminicola]SOE74868.1 type III secretion protein HrpB1/HrpK [Burkholderia sp. OK233]MBK3814670.1 HrpB1 family type III secretion system apparatus protein [Paraburkholderia aspalathi]NPT69878.1 HrpB1 family type III secretion system apparatus protein [Paraburkholderia madseniana]RDJ98692.1 HrpB1 family type III secretion system apparatus p
MSLTKCSNRLVSALIEALMFGAKHGHIEQSERLLAALHVLRPNFVELHAYDAWMMIRRRDFAEAVRLLRPLEQQALRGSFGPYVAALLAVSLCGLDDPAWRVYANEVASRNEDPDSVELVMTLMGKQSAAAAPAAEVQIDRGELQKLMQHRHLRA